MPAKRPKTPSGSRYALARGAARAAAAGWLLGAVGLILCTLPSVARAADPASPPAETGSKAAASGSKPAAAAPAGKPAAASASANRPVAGSQSMTESPRTTRDSTFGAAEAGAGSPPAAAAPSAAKNAPRSATGGPVTTATERPRRAGGSPTPAAATPARLAAASAGKSHGVQTVAHLDQKLTYQYNALGRRDPFQPMVGGEFVGVDVGGDAPVDVGGMKVVGIVWGTEDKFAMVEDGRGQSLVLRIGDKVMNGVVEGLRRDAVVVRITVDGQTQSVAIPLTRKGDKSNATR